MNMFLQKMHELSDTELRVVLIVLHTNEPLSVADIQHLTGRGRQVYEAIKSLQSKGIITQSDMIFLGTIRKWTWTCSWGEAILQPANTPSVIEIPQEEPVLVQVVDDIFVSEVVVEKSPVKQKTARKVTPKEPTSQQHPAVLAYVEVTQRRPKQFVADAIANTISEHDVDAWKQIVKQWILSGWNPTNIDGMLNMFQNRTNPAMNKQGKRKAIDTSISLQTPEEHAAKLEAYLRENGAYEEN